MLCEEVNNNMTKNTITRTWLAGLIGVAGGLAVAAIAIGFMLGYGGTFTAAPGGEGYDFVPSMDAIFWSSVVGIVGGGAIAAVGGLIQLVAWIGALMNTYQLQDKTWFAVLLVGGLIGFGAGIIGLITMVVYVIAGPDGKAVAKAMTSTSGALPGTLAPTS